MLFRRLVFIALLVGIVTGALLSAIQSWRVVPIISAAEVFERARAAELSTAAHAGHENGEHVHAASEWEPANGAERVAFTVVSDMLTASGYALVLLAIMAIALRSRAVSKSKMDWRYGLLWGLAGYAVVYVAPGLGLSPEIPGAAAEATAAASLTARQLWWVLSAVCAAVALGAVAFGKHRWRWAVLGLLAVPYLVGVPETAGVPFSGYSPAAVAELSKLAREFVWATAFANIMLWLGLGSASGWGMRRFLMKEVVD